MVYRLNSGKNFTHISNELLQCKEISYRARGIATYLLSKPGEWETSMTDLMNNSPKEGRDSIQTALKELQQHGFATRNRIRDIETNQYHGERWFISDDKGWVARMSGQPSVAMVKVDGRFVLADYTDFQRPENPATGEPGDRQINHNKEKNKESKEVKKEKIYPVWSVKAATWWYTKLENTGLLSKAILRKDKTDIIQSWAKVLDQINRLDDYDPTEIGKVLEWLFTTRNYVNGRGQPDKGGFWFNLNNFGSIASFRRSKDDTEETKFDWMYAGWKKDQKKPNRNKDNFMRG